MNTSRTMPERPIRRGNLVGPTILIGLGVVFLLNNLGWLGWEVWEALLRLWPVLLIAAGLDLLIGRRSALGSALIVVALLVIMGATVWWSGVWWPGGAPVAGETITQALNGATRADITIGIGAGTLRLHALDDSADLIHGAVMRAPRDQLTQNFSVSDDTAFFTLQNRGPSGWLIPFGNQRSDQIIWDLRLNQDVPIKLKVDAGVGVATLDLARLHISDVDVTTGIGKTTVILPAQGRAQAHIIGGIGETTITIPAGVAVRIASEAGLGQVHVQGDYPRQDKLYLSPNYETAANRVDLQVSGGIGSITIIQEHGR
jgi:hypothetical protein